MDWQRIATEGWAGWPAGCCGACRYEDVLPLLPCRGISRLPDRPRSVLVFAFPYYAGEWQGRNLARYAVLDDYHVVAGEYLRQAAVRLADRYPGSRFVPFVDNSPIREVRAAWLSGLGVIGWNGLLLHPVYGSYLFLGTVVTDLDVPCGSPKPGTCLECGRCHRACPTGAIGPGHPLERRRCRSHITQKKGTLTPWEGEQVRLGGKVWGCDLCVDACPLNARPVATPIPAFRQNWEPVLRPENLDRLLGEKPYGYRGREVLLRNWRLVSGTAPPQDKDGV